MIGRVSRRGPLRQLIRQSDGTLYDMTEERQIPPSELLDYLADGGFFKARRHDNGVDCTIQVLYEVLVEGIAQGLVPGVPGGTRLGEGSPLELLRQIFDVGAARGGVRGAHRDSTEEEVDRNPRGMKQAAEPW